MASFFRKYGTWVARHPCFVLCSSLAVVLILCLGLIRFKVETRPEKLWVGHGSRVAEEKHFFDSHLASFYRIEQPPCCSPDEGSCDLEGVCKDCTTAGMHL